MDDLLSTFITNCWQAFVTDQGRLLAQTIPVEQNHQFFDPLRHALRYEPQNEWSASAISDLMPQDGSPAREPFATFLEALFAWIVGEDEDGELDEEGQSYVEFDRYRHAYSLLSQVYASAPSPRPSVVGHRYAVLNNLIVEMAGRLVDAAAMACALSTATPKESTSPRSIQDATRLVLERSFQLVSAPWDDHAKTAASQEADDVAGDCVWALANMLWKIYAEVSSSLTPKRNLHNQANELRRTFASLSPPEDRRIQDRGDLIQSIEVSESWYWRGRLSCVLLDFRTASEELEKAYDAATEDYSALSPRRSIVSLLIPANLLLGRLAYLSTLDGYSLKLYIPLLQAFRSGNVSQWRQLLEHPYNRDWLRRRNVWVMLYERGEILVWRNLFKRALKTYYSLNPLAPKNRAPTAVFLTAAQVALDLDPDEGEVELEDVICILASLIDQGLILGYLAFSQQTLVLKASEDGMGGFPRLTDIRARNVHAHG